MLISLLELLVEPVGSVGGDADRHVVRLVAEHRAHGAVDDVEHRNAAEARVLREARVDRGRAQERAALLRLGDGAEQLVPRDVVPFGTDELAQRGRGREIDLSGDRDVPSAGRTKTDLQVLGHEDDRGHGRVRCRRREEHELDGDRRVVVAHAEAEQELPRVVLAVANGGRHLYFFFPSKRTAARPAPPIRRIGSMLLSSVAGCPPPVPGAGVGVHAAPATCAPIAPACAPAGPPMAAPAAAPARLPTGLVKRSQALSLIHSAASPMKSTTFAATHLMPAQIFLNTDAMAPPTYSAASLIAPPMSPMMLPIISGCTLW